MPDLIFILLTCKLAAGAGPAPSARTVSTRLAEIKKDAIAKGLVNKHFSIPCSNYSAAKAKGAGQRQRGAPRSKKRTREDEDEDEGMEMTDNESSRNKIVRSFFNSVCQMSDSHLGQV